MRSYTACGLKARTIAALSPIINDQSVVNVSVEFKQPTPLNSEVRMNYQGKDSQTNASLDNSNLDGGIDFEIRSQDGRKATYGGVYYLSEDNMRTLRKEKATSA